MRMKLEPCWQSATIVELQTAGVASIRFVDPARLPAHMRERVPENKRYKLDVVDLIEAGISSEAIGEAAESACVSVPISVGAGPTPLATPVAPATPYPVDALGDVLAGAARAIAAKVQCAPRWRRRASWLWRALRRRRWRTCACPMARPGR